MHEIRRSSNPCNRNGFGTGLEIRAAIIFHQYIRIQHRNTAEKFRTKLYLLVRLLRNEGKEAPEWELSNSLSNWWHQNCRREERKKNYQKKQCKPARKTRRISHRNYLTGFVLWPRSEQKTPLLNRKESVLSQQQSCPSCQSIAIR